MCDDVILFLCVTIYDDVADGVHENLAKQFHFRFELELNLKIQNI